MDYKVKESHTLRSPGRKRESKSKKGTESLGCKRMASGMSLWDGNIPKMIAFNVGWCTLIGL